jgi:S-adenosylhomocysteine hydrolase
MKNQIVKDYLISIDYLGENKVIRSIEMRMYDDEKVIYGVKYFDYEVQKKRQIAALVYLKDYHKFVNKLNRKDKLNNLNDVQNRR